MSLFIALPINPNCFKSENHGNNCRKNIGNLNTKMGGVKLLTEKEIVMEKKLETKDLKDLEDLIGA